MEGRRLKPGPSSPSAKLWNTFRSGNGNSRPPISSGKIVKVGINEDLVDELVQTKGHLAEKDYHLKQQLKKMEALQELKAQIEEKNASLEQAKTNLEDENGRLTSLVGELKNQMDVLKQGQEYQLFEDQRQEADARIVMLLEDNDILSNRLESTYSAVCQGREWEGESDMNARHQHVISQLQKLVTSSHNVDEMQVKLSDAEASLRIAEQNHLKDLAKAAAEASEREGSLVSKLESTSIRQLQFQGEQEALQETLKTLEDKLRKAKISLQNAEEARVEDVTRLQGQLLAAGQALAEAQSNLAERKLSEEGLQDRLRAAEEAKDQAKQACTQQVEELRELQRQALLWQEQERSVQEALAVVEGKLEASEQSRGELDLRCTEHANQVAVLQGQLEEAHRLQADLARDCARYVEELGKFEARVSEAQAAQRRAEDDLEAQVGRLEAVEHARSVAEEEVEISVGKVKATEEAHEAVKEELGMFIGRVEAAEQAQKRMEQELVVSQERVEAAELSRNDAVQELEALSSTVRSAELQHKIKETEAEKDRQIWEGRVQVAEEALRKAGLELEGLRREKEICDTHLKIAEDAREEAAQAMVTQANEIAQLKGQVETGQAELNATISSFQEQFNSMASETRSLERERDALNKQVQGVVKQRNLLKTQVAIHVKGLEDQMTLNHEEAMANSLLRQELVQMENLKGEIAQAKSLKEEHSKLQVHYEEIATEVEQLRARLAEMEGLRTQMAGLRTQMEEKEAKVKDMEQLKQKVVQMDQLRLELTQMEQLKNKVEEQQVGLNQMECLRQEVTQMEQLRLDLALMGQLKAQLEEQKAELKQMDNLRQEVTQVENLKNQVEKLQVQLASLEQVRELLREERTRAGQLQEEISEMESLRTQMEQQKVQLTRLGQMEEESAAEIERLKGELVETECVGREVANTQEVELLRREVAEMGEVKKEAARALYLEEEVKSLQTELAQMEDFRREAAQLQPLQERAAGRLLEEEVARLEQVKQEMTRLEGCREKLVQRQGLTDTGMNSTSEVEMLREELAKSKQEVEESKTTICNERRFIHVFRQWGRFYLAMSSKSQKERIRARNMARSQDAETMDISDSHSVCSNTPSSSWGTPVKQAEDPFLEEELARTRYLEIRQNLVGTPLQGVRDSWDEIMTLVEGSGIEDVEEGPDQEVTANTQSSANISQVVAPRSRRNPTEAQIRRHEEIAKKRELRRRKAAEAEDTSRPSTSPFPPSGVSEAPPISSPFGPPPVCSGSHPTPPAAGSSDSPVGEGPSTSNSTSRIPEGTTTTKEAGQGNQSVPGTVSSGMSPPPLPSTPTSTSSPGPVAGRAPPMMAPAPMVGPPPTSGPPTRASTTNNGLAGGRTPDQLYLRPSFSPDDALLQLAEKAKMREDFWRARFGELALWAVLFVGVLFTTTDYDVGDC
ncbi:unnamed protein product [Discosporangium mesarthrocarpum]